MKVTTEHPEVRAIEDAAWTLKEAASDLQSRKLSGPDKAALASVLRDLQRLTDRVVAVRDKRKRASNGSAEKPSEPRQSEVATDPEPTCMECGLIEARHEGDPADDHPFYPAPNQPKPHASEGQP